STCRSSSHRAASTQVAAVRGVVPLWLLSPLLALSCRTCSSHGGMRIRTRGFRPVVSVVMA
ncbi:MAG: hypothetical protein ACK53Y_20035, partial [bacterium]